MRVNNTSTDHWRTVCTKQDRARETRTDTYVFEVFTCIRADCRSGRVVRGRVLFRDHIVGDDT